MFVVRCRLSFLFDVWHLVLLVFVVYRSCVVCCLLFDVVRCCLSVRWYVVVSYVMCVIRCVIVSLMLCVVCCVLFVVGCLVCCVWCVVC